MEIGDKLRCIKRIDNLFGWVLFEEGKIYEVLCIDDNDIVLDHNLYANEYGSFSKEFIEKNFTKDIL